MSAPARDAAGDVVVVGTGNPFRRDDGVGVAVLERLAHVVPDAVRLAERDGEPTGLLGAWDGARLAVVVDAVAPDGAPGTLHRFEVRDGTGTVPDRVYREQPRARDR